MYIVDSHCDSIMRVAERTFPLINPYNLSQKYPQVQMYAMFAGMPGEDAMASYRRVTRYIGLFSIAIENEKDKIVKVTSYADIEKALAEGKHAALVTIEGPTGLRGDPEIFREFYNFGIRIFGLAWHDSDLACCNKVIDEGREDTGLTEKGKEIIKFGNELGIIFDVSHLSDKSFWDLIEIAKKPVIATHSNFRAVSNHSRNLTDDMAKALIDKGGVIGLNIFKPAVSTDPAKQDLPYFFKHLDHCLEKFGDNNIAFGGDIDGVNDDYLPSLDLNRSIHDQFIEFMQKHYSESVIEKVAYKNYMEFFKKYLN